MVCTEPLRTTLQRTPGRSCILGSWWPCTPSTRTIPQRTGHCTRCTGGSTWQSTRSFHSTLPCMSHSPSTPGWSSWCRPPSHSSPLHTARRRCTAGWSLRCMPRSQTSPRRKYPHTLRKHGCSSPCTARPRTSPSCTQHMRRTPGWSTTCTLWFQTSLAHMWRMSCSLGLWCCCSSATRRSRPHMSAGCTRCRCGCWSPYTGLFHSSPRCTACTRRTRGCLM